MMLPELVTFAKLLKARMPFWPPVMLRRIVGHRRVGDTENAGNAAAFDAAGIADIGKAVDGVNSVQAAFYAGTSIVGQRRVGASENTIEAGAFDAAGIGDRGKALARKFRVGRR
jgi:hypothetical protein